MQRQKGCNQLYFNKHYSIPVT